MKSETLTRYELEHIIEGSCRVERMNVLLDNDNLKRGHQVTLKDDDKNRLWTITAKHETITRTSIKQHWNNNI